MRVLCIIATPVFGGPHNQVVRLDEPLRRRGWQTLVVLPREDDTGVKRLRQVGVPFVQVSMHRPRATVRPQAHWEYITSFWPEVRKLREIIRDGAIDVVQICGLMNLQGGIAARLESRAVVWQLLSTFAPKPVRFAFMPMVRGLADIVMSTGTTTAAAHPGGTRLGARLVPFFPPVDTRRLCHSPEARTRARERMRIPNHALAIGTIGNMNWQKGHEFLVRAAKIVADAVPNACFRVVGAVTPTQAEYYDHSVRQLADKLGLRKSEQLQFLSPDGDVAELAAGFDIFVLTSRAEGVPTSLLEAMACGVPVVASDVGSVREIVAEGQTGMLAKPQDVEAIAQHLIKLARTPDLRTAMGRKAKQVALEQYDVEICADTHVRAYEAALARCLGKSDSRIAGSENRLSDLARR